MTREAIILAGGLGTRLRNVIGDLPKPMADIEGKPFLAYLLTYLKTQRITDVVLAVGYKHGIIKNYFKNQYQEIKITYSIEEELLGTGGAIKRALSLRTEENVLILNGDSLFNIDLENLFNFHDSKRALLTIAMKRYDAKERYGALIVDKNHRVTGFQEKSQAGGNYMNGGIYVLNKTKFEAINVPLKFSFEKDFLGKLYKNELFYGLEYSDYFIDIGIPEDYQRAKREIKGLII